MADNLYERQRQELIARNRARLQALGVGSASDALQARAKPTKPKAKRKAKASTSHEPSRRSSRLHPESAEQPDASPEATELALCIINEECPRCGKVVVRGHKEHMDDCTAAKPAPGSGTVEIEGLDELEAEEEKRLTSSTEAHTRRQHLQESPAKRSRGPKSQAEKLQELEMSGLVDFTKEHARFAVIGSTGQHYTVELANEKHTCQCMDFRSRRRACKHIKLVLQQVGIPADSKDWHQAVSAKLDSLAQEGNSIQSDSQHETNGKAAEAAADQVESRPKSGITHQEKPKNAEGAALSWPKRSNKRK